MAGVGWRKEAKYISISYFQTSLHTLRESIRKRIMNNFQEKLNISHEILKTNNLGAGISTGANYSVLKSILISKKLNQWTGQCYMGGKKLLITV